MTTQSWASVIDHSSDAGFRAWGSDLSAKLAAVGLVQTADTGQIDWTTVARPGVGTEAGYEIWTFGDSLQGTAPIYLKIIYGTHGGATRAMIRLVVGTGSNGSGTLTGTALTSSLNCYLNGVQPGSFVTAYQSFLCHAEGFLGLVFHTNMNTAGYGALGFLITRTCDADGAPTAEGAHIIYPNNLTAVTSPIGNVTLRFAATAANYGGTAHPAFFIPSAFSNSIVGTDIQVFMGWTMTPQTRPIFSLCCVYAAEINPFTTFTVALVGTAPRTYIAIGRQLGTWWAANDSTLIGGAMLWE